MCILCRHLLSFLLVRRTFQACDLNLNSCQHTCALMSHTIANENYRCRNLLLPLSIPYSPPPPFFSLSPRPDFSPLSSSPPLFLLLPFSSVTFLLHSPILPPLLLPSSPPPPHLPVSLIGYSFYFSFSLPSPLYLHLSFILLLFLSPSLSSSLHHLLLPLLFFLFFLLGPIL